MTGTLEFVLILLGAAVLVVAVFRNLGLPPLIGYLLVGIAIGPHSLGWTPDLEGTRHLAEFGVVFLMFSIGLEFSLPQLFRMRRAVFGLGGLQVGVTLALVAIVALTFGAAWQTALALGGALAMSSTAISAKMLAERVELETPHGRDTLGVLLFQDLAVVPLLILLPAIANPGEGLALALGAAALKAAIVLVVVLLVGQRLMRRWFHLIARRRSHELFVLNVLLITLGLAYVTDAAGLSAALGAFLAGMLIAETEFRHQVEDDIRPFRDVLLGLFFVTVGMMLDLATLASQPLLVVAVFALTTAAKFGTVVGLARMLGASAGAAIRSALALAGAGEFGLVLITLAGALGLLGESLLPAVIAGMLLSMIATPFLIQHADRIALRLAPSEWMLRSLALHQAAVQSLAAERHAVILGYGRTGQNLARFLEQEGIGYVALDLDPERVREAVTAGESVVYGDGARRELLIAAGLNRARAVIVTYSDTPSALKVLHHAHAINPSVPVLVRTRDETDIERLTQAGAAEVVPETFEASLMLASHALVLLGVPIRRVLERVRGVREERYALLRGFFRGASDTVDTSDDAAQLRLHSVLLAKSAHAVGRTLAEIGLESVGAEVTLVRRRGIRAAAPGPETRFEAEDVVVLRGTAQALAAAELRLVQG